MMPGRIPSAITTRKSGSSIIPSKKKRPKMHIFVHLFFKRKYCLIQVVLQIITVNVTGPANTTANGSNIIVTINHIILHADSFKHPQFVREWLSPISPGHPSILKGEK